MPRSLDGARVTIRQPEATDNISSPSDIRITERVGGDLGSASFSFVNRSPAFDTSAQEAGSLVADRFKDVFAIRSGDRAGIRLSETDPNANVTPSYLMMVRDYEIDPLVTSTNYDASDDVEIATVECTDYALTRCSFVNVYRDFRDREIAGSDDAIVETLIREELPRQTLSRTSVEVDTDTFDETIDFISDGKSLRQCLVELADETGAVIASDVTLGFNDFPVAEITFKDPDNAGTQVTLGTGDFAFGGYAVTDDGVRNRARVEGPTRTIVADEQPTVDGFETVTNSTRKTAVLSPAKNTIPSVKVATDRLATGAAIRARIQQNDGNGNPIAPGDPTKDIEQKLLTEDFIGDDGSFTRFRFAGDDPVPDDPVLIMDTTGGNQDVGVDSNGNLAYKLEYEQPLVARSDAGQSQKRFLRRDIRLTKGNIDSAPAARDIGQRELQGRRRPTAELTFEATSDAAHNLSLYDRPVIDIGPPSIQGEYLVTEITDAIDGTQRRKTITATKPVTIDL